eukprot:3578189-Prorocentrum_lima.AAC.1
MTSSLVGSEMCIRDSDRVAHRPAARACLGTAHSGCGGGFGGSILPYLFGWAGSQPWQRHSDCARSRHPYN